MSDQIIKPTVGRIVHYYPGPDDPQLVEEAPLAAIVAKVWSDTCVNLTIFNPNGAVEPNPPTSITLVQPGADPPDQSGYCTWMPYQVKKQTGSESGEKAAGTQVIGGGHSSAGSSPGHGGQA